MDLSTAGTEWPSDGKANGVLASLPRSTHFCSVIRERPILKLKTQDTEQKTAAKCNHTIVLIIN
ncbi:MAG: hypothetical protein PHI97_07000 [Desulfobulbus sp.]|nr:hypothetical protein [Desulfobulbus sp.]